MKQTMNKYKKNQYVPYNKLYIYLGYHGQIGFNTSIPEHEQKTDHLSMDHETKDNHTNNWF